MKRCISKILIVILTMIMCLMVLSISSCSKPKNVTLSVWAVDGGNANDPQQAYAINLAKNFQEQNPDIKLEWVAFGTQGSALNDKLKVAMANDQGPDILQSWGGTFMGQFADAGKLLDLSKELANIPTSAAAKGAMTYKGKLYGVAPFFAIAGLFVNEGIFQQNNLTVPKTIEELEAVADTLKGKGIQPFTAGSKDQWPILHTFMFLVDRYGGPNAFPDAFQRKIRFDSPDFVQAGTKMQEWAKKKYYGDKPLSEAYADAQLLMQTGKAAMQLSGSWLCALYSDPKSTDQTIGFYAFPIVTGGKGFAEDYMGMTDIGFVASKTGAAKKDAIVRFMKYAMTVEALSADPGRVASVPGVAAKNRITGMASEEFSKAKNIQFWWDQDLPTALASSINMTVQSFMDPSTNVQDALKKFEDRVIENLGEVQ